MSSDISKDVPQKKRINFKKKIIPEHILLELMETYKKESMITGSAFKLVTNDLLNLRKVCELIVKANDNDDIKDMRGMVEILKLVL